MHILAKIKGLIFKSHQTIQPKIVYDTSKYTPEEKLAMLEQFKLSNLAYAARLGYLLLPASYLTESIETHIADELADNPEEWTELTGIKLGMEPFFQILIRNRTKQLR